MLYVQYAPNSTFVTVPHAIVMGALEETARRRYTSPSFSDRYGTLNVKVEMPQPYTSVLCELNPIMDENDTRPIQFPDTYCAPKKDDSEGWLNKPGIINYTAITRQQIWDEFKKRQEGRMIWVNDIPIAGLVAGTGLGVIVVQSEPSTAGKRFLTTSACVVGARWANTTTTIEIGKPTNYDFSIADVDCDDLTPESLSTVPQWSQPSVRLSKQWAESLNPKTNMHNRKMVDNLLRWMPPTDNICPTNGSYRSTREYLRRPFMHEALVASLLANGMSNKDGIHGRFPASVFTTNDALDVEGRPVRPGIIMTFHSFVEGYAWNLEGTSIKIAIPVLIIYCIYTIAYVLFTLITGRFSRAWSAISEFTALAFNSTPTKVLEHTSAGIVHRDTLQSLVSVRKLEAMNQLELVFKQDEESGGGGGYQNPTVGRDY